MTLFVDSSVLFAAANRRDRWNERAQVILESESALLTTDHVLVETWHLANARLGADVAERLWGGLRGSIAIECVLAADLEAAWGIGRAFPDQTFSVVDRTCFAVMERLGLHRAASFDDDFAIFRFGASRDRAFEIVR